VPKALRPLHARRSMPPFGPKALFVVPLFALFVLIALLVRRLVLHLGRGAVGPPRVALGR
jgi:hypothetical protein